MTIHDPRLVDELIGLTQRWASTMSYDEERVVAVRDQLLHATAAHAERHIPVYRRLVAELGASGHRPLLTCDVFKAYDPRWIDLSDWAAMTVWLGQLHDRPLVAPTAAHDLDDWLTRIESTTTKVVCSSGSSGMLSLVPRGLDEWAATRLTSTAALAPLIARRVGRASERLAVRAGLRLLRPGQMASLAERAPRRATAAFVLDFTDGRTGNASVSSELARSFQYRHHLFPGRLSAVAVRALARGPRTDADVAALEGLQTAVVDGGASHMERFVEAMRTSASAGRRAFVFGTPHQLLQLVELVERTGRPIVSPRGSVVLSGGGWKTFGGSAIPRDELVRRVSAALGVEPHFVLEAYSMSELNTVMLRCEAGRFHVPPMVEAFVVDSCMRESPRGTGTFAFRDPFATSRPGFLVTGDAVTMVDDRCTCGLTGAAVTSIERGGRQEVKGCAGIAASLPV